jgi:hypothetical protein
LGANTSDEILSKSRPLQVYAISKTVEKSIRLDLPDVAVAAGGLADGPCAWSQEPE